MFCSITGFLYIFFLYEVHSFHCVFTSTKIHLREWQQHESAEDMFEKSLPKAFIL